MKTKFKRIYIYSNRYWFLQDLQERNPKTGKPLQKKHKLTKVSDGEVLMLKAYAELLERLDPVKKKGSMVNLIDDWMINKEFGLPKYAEKTQKEYRRMALIIREAFFEFSAAKILPSHAAKFVDTNWPTKPTMANNFKDLMSLMFKFGARCGYCTTNPCAEIQNYKESSGRDRYITDDELSALRKGLLTGLDGKPNRAGEMMVVLVDLLAITGQRIGDVLSLRWDQISPQGILFRPSKTQKSTGLAVPVEMTDQLKDVLERARKIGNIKSMFVIHTLEGAQYDYSGALTAWRRGCKRARKFYEDACKKSGVVPDATFLIGMNPHDLRHKAITDADKQGLDPQKLAGHSDIKMTNRYIEITGIDWVKPPKIGGI